MCFLISTVFFMDSYRNIKKIAKKYLQIKIKVLKYMYYQEWTRESAL